MVKQETSLEKRITVLTQCCPADSHTFTGEKLNPEDCEGGRLIHAQKLLDNGYPVILHSFSGEKAPNNLGYLNDVIKVYLPGEKIDFKKVYAAPKECFISNEDVHKIGRYKFE